MIIKNMIVKKAEVDLGINIKWSNMSQKNNLPTLVKIVYWIFKILKQDFLRFLKDTQNLNQKLMIKDLIQ